MKIYIFFMKFYNFYEILQNFMTLIVSQKLNTETCKIVNYICNYTTINRGLLFIISLDIGLIWKLY